MKKLSPTMKGKTLLLIGVLAGSFIVMFLTGTSTAQPMHDGMDSSCVNRCTQRALQFKSQADHYLRNGSHSEAIAAYKKAVQLCKDMSNAWFNMAIACYANRDLIGTIAALDEVIRIQPNDVEALYNRGCLSLYVGEVALAKTLFDRALSCCPTVQAPLPHQIQAGLKFLAMVANATPQQQHALAALLADGLEPSLSA